MSGVLSQYCITKNGSSETYLALFNGYSKIIVDVLTANYTYRQHIQQRSYGNTYFVLHISVNAAVSWDFKAWVGNLDIPRALD